MFDIRHWPECNVDAHANISALFHLFVIMPMLFNVWNTSLSILQCWPSCQHFALFMIRKWICVVLSRRRCKCFGAVSGVAVCTHLLHTGLYSLSPSVAQLSSDFHYFSCFPATTDIVIDVDELDNILPSWSSSTLTSLTMIFLTNQRPRKCDKKDRHIDILTLWRPMPSGQRP